MKHPKWVQTLPEIIGALRELAESEEWADLSDADEKWARRGRDCQIGNLLITEEGNADRGPYRITVCANSTEEIAETYYDNWEEPLLKLEIRPSPWWISEVRSGSQGILAKQVNEIVNDSGL